MTRARAITLFLGVVALLIFSWWRLSPGPGGAGSTESRATLPELGASAVQSFGGRVMGTSYSVKCELRDEELLIRAQREVQAALQKVDREMSTYRKDSEVSAFNRLKAGGSLRVSPSVLEVVLLSRSLFELSGGAFDITVRPLVRAWGFGSDADKLHPGRADLESLRRRVGFGLISIDEETSSLSKSVDGVEIDLGGVAKGYGVDRAADALLKLGIRNFLVEVGGEIRFLGLKLTGENEHKAWTLAIEEPVSDRRRIHGIVYAKVGGGALATSGDYRNFRRSGGKVVSHLLDPRKGAPTPHRTASVSVFRPTAAEADGLATALSVLEPEAALALANREGWAVYLLVHREGGGFLGHSSREFNLLSMEMVSKSSFPVSPKEL